MIQSIGSKNIWKMFVYSLYMCAQILLLASLLLTATDMLVHMIFMILTVTLYFTVCLKNPGVYTANTQPNLQDISNKDCREINFSKQQQLKKMASLRVLPSKQIETISKIQDNQTNTITNSTNMKKKTSLQVNIKLELPQQYLQQQRLKTSIKIQNNSDKQKNQRKSNLFNDATNILKSALSNWTNYISKKNIQPEEQNKNKNQQASQKQQNKQQIESKYKKETQKQFSLSDFQNIEKIKQSMRVVDQQKHQKENDHEDEPKIVIRKLQINDEIIQGKQASRNIYKKNSILNKMMKNKRYCRMCQFYQPLRVKHCYTCDQCISTYDHHCPWLATCIGEKNKLVFLLYIFFQFVQFLTMFIDLIRHLSTSQLQNKSSVLILLISVILFVIALSTLFIFHVFLVYHNLTTWQLFRWNKVSYLNLFDYEKMKSPFSKGCKQNFKMFWKISWMAQNKIWSEQISEDLSRALMNFKSKNKSNKCIEGQTDRKMHTNHKMF